MFQKANGIWRRAGIRFDARVLEWKFDPATLDDIVLAASQRRGDAELLADVTGTDPRFMTAIFLRSVGGSTGSSSD